MRVPTTHEPTRCTNTTRQHDAAVLTRTRHTALNCTRAHRAGCRVGKGTSSGSGTSAAPDAAQVAQYHGCQGGGEPGAYRQSPRASWLSSGRWPPLPCWYAPTSPLPRPYHAPTRPLPRPYLAPTSPLPRPYLAPTSPSPLVLFPPPPLSLSLSMSMWFVSPSRSLFSRHPWLIKIPQASTTAGSKLPIRSAAVNRVSARKSIGGRVHKYPTPSFPYPLLFPHPACAPQRRDFRCAATRVCGSCVRASAGSCVCAGAARAHAHTHADACARSRAPRRRIFTCVVGEKPVWRFGRGWGRRDGAFLKTDLACPCAWARARALKHADLQKQAKPCFFFFGLGARTLVSEQVYLYR